MKKMLYRANGTMDFAYGKNGILCTLTLDIKDIAKMNAASEENVREYYTFQVGDLYEGKEFLRMIREKGIMNSDGELIRIFVGGYLTNLGIASNDFYQGNFLIMEDVFEELCEEHDILVEWANK